MRQKLVIAALVLLSTAVVHAQVASLYLTSSSARFSNAQTATQSQYSTFWTSGIGGGVTLNFLPVGPIKLGIDLRGSTRPGTVGADTAMGGFRVGINPPLIPFKPYIQASGGYVATRTASASKEYAAWEILGGIDFPLVHFLDLRLVEVGGGSGYNIPGATSTPNISLFTVNSGIVLHF
jgi:hypothetical protein